MPGDAAAPPQPRAILRGHKAQVHAARFIRNSDRLVTGDADGFVVVWDLVIMRPRAVWRAHGNAILGVADWGADRIITHGRDNRLVVWNLAPRDEERLSKVLPLDSTAVERPQPWMLHLLEVNTMNFCSFSSCPPLAAGGASSDELLVSVPNTLASEAIDVFHLPSKHRLHTVKLGDKIGMVMAVSIFHHEDRLTLAAGYENGLAIVARLEEASRWTVTYRAQVHSQPILSLDVTLDAGCFLTSGADAIIAKHPLPRRSTSRPVGLITAPADASQADTDTPTVAGGAGSTPTPSHFSLLSTALAAQPATSSHTATSTTAQVETQPIKVVNTKHSGQQSLRARSDGRIFATAGWDSRVRIYSAKTLREAAVLKWHQTGCYAVALSDIKDDPTGQQEAQSTPARQDQPSQARAGVDGRSTSLIPKLVEATVRDKRLNHAQTAHWVAAGSKDGKVSIWDIF